MKTENNKMYVKVIDTSGLDQDTIQKIEDKMLFTRWWSENDTTFCELKNSKGDIIRIFPERIQSIKQYNMKTKTINMEGRYMSTYSFVGENDLHDDAENLFGVDWEAEDDVNQIQTLLDVLHPNKYYVSLIPDCKYEDDILVTLKEEEELTIEKAKKFLKDNGFYTDTLWHNDEAKFNIAAEPEMFGDMIKGIIEKQPKRKYLVINGFDGEELYGTISDKPIKEGLKEKKDEEQ